MRRAQEVIMRSLKSFRVGLIAAVMAILVLVGFSPTAPVHAGDRPGAKKPPARDPAAKVEPKSTDDTLEPSGEAAEAKKVVVATRAIATTAKELEGARWNGQPIYGYVYVPMGTAKYAVVKTGETPVAYFEIRSKKVPISDKGSKARKDRGAPQTVEVRTLQVYTQTAEPPKLEDMTPVEELGPFTLSTCTSIPAGWKAMGEVEMFREGKSDKDTSADAWQLEVNHEEIPAVGLVLNQLQQRNKETKELELELVFRTRLPGIPANPSKKATPSTTAADVQAK